VKGSPWQAVPVELTADRDLKQRRITDMRAFSWWQTFLGIFAAGAFTAATASFGRLAILCGAASVVCLIGAIRSVEQRVTNIETPKIRVSCETDIRDQPQVVFRFENISRTTAYDIRVRDILHQGRTLTFQPIPQLGAGKYRDEPFRVLERDGDPSVMFGDSFEHFISGDEESHKLTAVRRKQGDYTDLFKPLEVIVDVFFWDEDRKCQFKATHRLSYEYSAFKVRVEFISQTELLKPWRSRRVD
jgi:hypothetical protein